MSPVPGAGEHRLQVPQSWPWGGLRSATISRGGRGPWLFNRMMHYATGSGLYSKSP